MPLGTAWRQDSDGVNLALGVTLNIQTDDEFLITLILLGQPPLLKNISELQPLKERISIKYNLEPLDIQNTLNYVVHRLRYAGATRGIFSVG